jgi:hypothetical protein
MRVSAEREAQLQAVFQDVSNQLVAVLQKAPKGRRVDLVVLDAVITVAARYGANGIPHDDDGALAQALSEHFTKRVNELLDDEPDREHELALAMERYTDPCHPEYDPVFTAEMKAVEDEISGKTDRLRRERGPH